MGIATIKASLELVEDLLYIPQNVDITNIMVDRVAGTAYVEISDPKLNVEEGVNVGAELIVTREVHEGDCTDDCIRLSDTYTGELFYHNVP